jgi:hypothetical protein
MVMVCSDKGPKGAVSVRPKPFGTYNYTEDLTDPFPNTFRKTPLKGVLS